MKLVKTSLTGLVLLAATIAAPALAGDVAINIHQLQAKPGKLYVALQKQGEFMQERASYGQVVASVEAGDKLILFKDVAPGDYSVSVWHDIDEDGKFSTASNGAPLDGWSILNAQTLQGPPRWEQVKFTVPAAGKALDLAMVYPG